MGWFQNRFQSARVRDVVGLDFGASAIKAVRLREMNNEISVAATALIPPPGPGERHGRLPLPPEVIAKYAAISASGERSIVRLLDIPVLPNEAPEEQIQRQFNLTGNYRMGHFPLPAQTKGFLRTVAVAMEEELIQSILAHLQVGAPAPRSLELSGLAALNAYLATGGETEMKEAVVFVEGGTRSLYLFVVHHRRPLLIRRFDLGTAHILERVRQHYDLDASTAENLVLTGAVDLSGVFTEVMGEFFRQLAIARDFAQRQEQCQIRRALLSGGLSCNPYWARGISEVLHMPAEAWNPFAVLSHAPGAHLERWKGQEGRFAAAVGAALGELRNS